MILVSELRARLLFQVARPKATNEKLTLQNMEDGAPQILIQNLDHPKVAIPL